MLKKFFDMFRKHNAPAKKIREIRMPRPVEQYVQLSLPFD